MHIAISIVTGTYNRLEHLQRMVNSVRCSVLYFRHYEIVVVDGGSTDGTQDWCKTQSDIVLIEQGKLYGAVRAFNEGAYNSRGHYVILANDDIKFLGDSILRAYTYMEQHPHCGIGCFYQNRDSKPWHVSVMNAQREDGSHVQVYYGQVCIVPKQLGDACGWWGDYLYTYGGDNELSCNVLEAGYTIDPIECACINDNMVHDILRITNNTVNKGAMSDTELWRDRWPRGPVIPAIASTVLPYGTPRILYAPIFEPGNILQHITKTGLLSALEHMGLVVQYDYLAYDVESLYSVADTWQPDIFIFQLQGAQTYINAHVLKELRSLYPQSIFVNWNGDYNHANLHDTRYIEMMRYFHVASFVTTSIQELYKQYGVDIWYWQIGYEVPHTTITHDVSNYDVIYMGNEYIPARTVLGRFLTSLKDIGLKVGVYGSWKSIKSDGNTLYDYTESSSLYSRSKLAISTQEYPQAYGFVSNRLVQSMAAGGCLVLQQRFGGVEELLGLRHGEHLILWDTYDELLNYIIYYMEHEDERMEISNTGNQYVLSNYSFQSQVAKLWTKLQDAGLL